MAIATLVLSLVFLTLGALPTLTSHHLATSVREQLPHATIQAEVSAVPTWRILGGHLDHVDMALGDLSAEGYTLHNVRVQAGPVEANKPVTFLVQFAVPTAPIEARIAREADQYVASLANQLGIPGASLTDLTIQLDESATPVRISGRLVALGGLIGMDVAITGRLRIQEGTLGLQDAVVTLLDEPRPLGFVPLATLPEPPVGVLWDIHTVTTVGSSLQVAVAVSVPDLDTIPTLLQRTRAGLRSETS